VTGPITTTTEDALLCDDPDCDLAALTHDHWTPEASITTVTSTEVEDHG
jgi:hypothetical protein